VTSVHEVVGTADRSVWAIEGTGGSAEDSVGRTDVVSISNSSEDLIDLTINLRFLALSTTTESLEGLSGNKENLHQGVRTGNGVVSGVGYEIRIEEGPEKLNPTFSAIFWEDSVQWGTFSEQSEWDSGLKRRHRWCGLWDGIWGYSWHGLYFWILRTDGRLCRAHLYTGNVV
jgi:hypothetical protein